MSRLADEYLPEEKDRRETWFDFEEEEREEEASFDDVDEDEMDLDGSCEKWDFDEVAFYFGTEDEQDKTLAERKRAGDLARRSRERDAAKRAYLSKLRKQNRKQKSKKDCIDIHNKSDKALLEGEEQAI